MTRRSRSSVRTAPMRGANAGEPARLSAVMTDAEMQLEKCRFILPINGAGVHAAISSKPSLCLLVATLGAKTISRSGRRTGVTSALCEVLGGIDALAKRNRRPVATGARLAGRGRHRGRDLFLPDSTLARESPGGIAELPNPDRYSAVASCGACGALRRGMDDQILDYAFPGTVFDPEIIQVLASALTTPGRRSRNPAAGLLGPATRAQCGKSSPSASLKWLNRASRTRRRSLKTQCVSFEPTTKTISAARHKGIGFSSQRVTDCGPASSQGRETAMLERNIVCDVPSVSCFGQ